MLSTMLHKLRQALRRWLGVTPDDFDAKAAWGRQETLSYTLDALRERVVALERAETVRAAEHAAAMDAMQRLYKRVAARIARETTPPNGEAPPEESPLQLRRRLRP